MKLRRILAWGLSLALGASTMLATAAGDGMRVPLGGHVPAALGAARPLPPSLLDPKILDDALTLTIVLQRSDQAGFEQFLRDVYDPQSPQYRKFATPVELAERYGPTPDAYAQVRSHFEREGFSLVADSANRLTLTLRTSRTNAERALAVRIADYRIGDRIFHANDTDPTLPAEIANKVAAIVGLNGLARPEPQWNAIVKAFQSVFYQLCKLAEGPAPTALNNVTSQSNNTPPASQCVPPPPDPTTQVAQLRTGPHAATPWKSARGVGQKVGILAYDTFVPSDVANFLAFAELPAGNIANLSQVHVNGGAALGAEPGRGAARHHDGDGGRPGRAGRPVRRAEQCELPEHLQRDGQRPCDRHQQQLGLLRGPDDAIGRPEPRRDLPDRGGRRDQRVQRGR